MQCAVTVAPRTRRGSFLASLLWAPTEVNTCISPHRGPNNSFPPQLCFPSGKSLFGPPPPPCAGRRSSHSGPSTRPKTTASRGPSPSAWAAAAPRRLEESKSQKKSSPAAATTAEVGRLQKHQLLQQIPLLGSTLFLPRNSGLLRLPNFSSAPGSPQLR